MYIAHNIWLISSSVFHKKERISVIYEIYDLKDACLRIPLKLLSILNLTRPDFHFNFSMTNAWCRLNSSLKLSPFESPDWYLTTPSSNDAFCRLVESQTHLETHIKNKKNLRSIFSQLLLCEPGCKCKNSTITRLPFSNG